MNATRAYYINEFHCSVPFLPNGSVAYALQLEPHPSAYSIQLTLHSRLW